MRNACFLVALVCFIAGTGFAAELVLVREGKPNAVIIVPPEPAQPAPATKAKTAPPKIKMASR